MEGINLNSRHIWLVFRKEFVDLLRDRKTWLGALIIPLVVIPLVFFLLGWSMSSVERDARTHIPYAVIGEASHPLVQDLSAIPGTRLIRTDRPFDALKAAEVRVVVELPDGFEQRIRQGKSASLTLWYDASNQKSQIARDVFRQVIADYEKTIIAQRLGAAGLAGEFIEPVQVTDKSVASNEKVTGSILSGIIPLMLVLALATGGIPAATDLIAGEKERGTLEALVAAPVGSGSVLSGKLLAVMVMSSTSSFASLFSMTIAMSFTAFSGSEAAMSYGFLTPGAVVTLFVMFLLLSGMFAGFELAISTMANSVKEAQTYMSPVIFVAMVPAYMMMPLAPADIPAIYYMLPVFNGMAVFKEIFYGSLDASHVLTAVGTSVVYVALAVRLASRLFQREGLLVK